MSHFLTSIKKAGLNPKVELLKVALLDSLVAGLASLVFIFNLQKVFAGYGVAVIFVIDVFFFNRYGKIIKEKEQALEDEFVDVFTYFGIYISNGYNVYQALLQITDFCDEGLKSLIETLVKDIDSDKTIRPFIKFGNNFSNVSIKEVLLSIYQMVDEGGGSSYIRQYETLFGKFSETRHKKTLEARKDKLSSLTILPLVGSGIIMVVLTISLVQVMGSFFNGL